MLGRARERQAREANLAMPGQVCGQDGGGPGLKGNGREVSDILFVVRRAARGRGVALPTETAARRPIEALEGTIFWVWPPIP